MLDSISGFASAVSRPTFAQAFTGTQRTAVQSILSEYDAENLSSEDAEAINAAFHAEGIRPSAGIKSTIEAEGFDISDLRPSGGPQGGGGRPPPPPPADVDDVISTLLDVLEEYEGQALDAQDFANVQDKLQEAGYSPRENYIDLNV